MNIKERKRELCQFWIDEFLDALRSEFGEDGVVIRDDIVYVKLLPGAWIDFTLPMPSNGPRKEVP